MADSSWTRCINIWFVLDSLWRLSVTFLINHNYQRKGYHFVLIINDLLSINDILFRSPILFLGAKRLTLHSEHTENFSATAIYECCNQQQAIIRNPQFGSNFEIWSRIKFRASGWFQQGQHWPLNVIYKLRGFNDFPHFRALKIFANFKT